MIVERFIFDRLLLVLLGGSIDAGFDFVRVRKLVVKKANLGNGVTARFAGDESLFNKELVFLHGAMPCLRPRMTICHVSFKVMFKLGHQQVNAAGFGYFLFKRIPSV